MNEDPYVYPGTQILRNKLDIRDQSLLDETERRLVTQRIRPGAPGGNFDLPHLEAIHRHLFQDVYEWAGQIRTLEISKGGDQFQFHRFIQTGVADVHRRIVAANYLQGLPGKEFADRAAEIIGDLNYAHPFREGNGRTQLQYLKQLAERAGHSMDLTKLQPDQWLHASTEAHQARYDAMARAIEAALLERSRQRDEASKGVENIRDRLSRNSRDQGRKGRGR
jgi:cell filamentation protein